MIPAPKGLVALYEQLPPYNVRHQTREVIAFDEDGAALVLPEDRSRSLAKASDFPRFAGLAESPHEVIVQIMPADGWMVERLDDQGERWATPLIGWGLTAEGAVIALDTDSSGEVGPVNPMTSASSSKFRIYHPDEVNVGRPLTTQPAPPDGQVEKPGS